MIYSNFDRIATFHNCLLNFLNPREINFSLTIKRYLCSSGQDRDTILGSLDQQKIPNQPEH